MTNKVTLELIKEEFFRYELFPPIIKLNNDFHTQNYTFATRKLNNKAVILDTKRDAFLYNHGHETIQDEINSIFVLTLLEINVNRQ